MLQSKNNEQKDFWIMDNGLDDGTVPSEGILNSPDIITTQADLLYTDVFSSTDKILIEKQNFIYVTVRNRGMEFINDLAVNLFWILKNSLFDSGNWSEAGILVGGSVSNRIVISHLLPQQSQQICFNIFWSQEFLGNEAEKEIYLVAQLSLVEEAETLSVTSLDDIRHHNNIAIKEVIVTKERRRPRFTFSDLRRFNIFIGTIFRKLLQRR